MCAIPKAAKAREIPWGALGHVPDERALEPWERVAAAEELALLRGASAAGRREHPPCPVLIGFTPTWTGAIARYDPRAGEPCPGCGSVTHGRECAVTVRPGQACVVCGVSRAAPVQWPMQAPLRSHVRRLRGGVGRVA